MKAILAATAAIFLIGGTATAVLADPSTGSELSPAEANALLRTAHSPSEYHALAGYFEHAQTALLIRAAQEKQEWERRSQNVVGVAAKYPRPVDSSRYRYEYFLQQADHMHAQAEHYEQLAAAH